jgi:hypothetical protein
MLAELQSNIHWAVFVCFLFAGNAGDVPTIPCWNYNRIPHPLLLDQHEYFLQSLDNASFRSRLLALRGGSHDKKMSPTRQTLRSVATDADAMKATGSWAGEQVQHNSSILPRQPRKNHRQHLGLPYHLKTNEPTATKHSLPSTPRETRQSAGALVHC